MMEPFETLVDRVRAEELDRRRAALEDLIYDIRETTDSPHMDGGWSFDIPIDDAVTRLADFIETGGGPFFREHEVAKYGDGWNAALEFAAKIAEGYPEKFGEEYVAHGHIGLGQDHAARDIAAAIRKYKNGNPVAP